MEATIYADILFFVNFSMDFITLWASSYLFSAKRSAKRLSLGAAVGALYGVIAAVCGLLGIWAYISAGAVSVLMVLCAFGMAGGIWELLRQSAVVWGCGALFGGLMTAFLMLFSKRGLIYTPTEGVAVTAVSAAALYVTVRAVSRTKSRKNAFITLILGDRSITAKALCDSGNLLRDPISQAPVITVSKSLLYPLLGKERTDCLTDGGRDMEKLSLKIRVIPMKTTTHSTLCTAFLPDSVIISDMNGHKKEVHCLVAPIDCPENHFAGCGASCPTDIL